MKKLWLIAFSLLTACGPEEPAHKAEARPPAPINVQTIAAKSVQWGETREVAGTVRARVTGNVAARILAQVREVRVNTGDIVRAGQVLIVLDSKDLDVSIRQAEEAQREARSAEGEVTSAIRAAKAQLDLAQATFRRMKDLFDKKSISNQEFDEAQARLRMAEANHDMALAKQRQLQARIAQSGESVKNAGIMKGYAELTSPFNGIVMEKRIEPGSMASPGMPLLVIEQTGAYRLEAPLDESLAANLKRGQRVEVTLDALDRTVQSPVGEIAPAADPATRSLTVKLDLPALPNLRSGMSGRARFQQTATQALSLPAAAVHPQGSLQLVYVNDQGKARTRIVTTGDRRGDLVQILSGLTESEAVIHPVPATLTDGTSVEARQ
ncbi:MAG: efflux RND transporter periplasmic adaptor subunit [Acidobacteria bacterium]|nr:efflux RND transporter periplasmic adaptor subunit [Acidobacteriota bacterium]